MGYHFASLIVHTADPMECERVRDFFCTCTQEVGLCVWCGVCEGPRLRVGKEAVLPRRTPAAPHPQPYTLDTLEALDPQHSTTSCAAYVHYAQCNRTMCLSSVTQHARHAHAQLTRETHHTWCTTSRFSKVRSVRFACASSVFMSLVVVRHPRYGLTYGSVRPVSSVPGPMTATGLTGRCGSFFYAFLQSALGAFSLFCWSSAIALVSPCFFVGLIVFFRVAPAVAGRRSARARLWMSFAVVGASSFAGDNLLGSARASEVVSVKVFVWNQSLPAVL